MSRRCNGRPIRAARQAGGTDTGELAPTRLGKRSSMLAWLRLLDRCRPRGLARPDRCIARGAIACNSIARDGKRKRKRRQER